MLKWQLTIVLPVCVYNSVYNSQCWQSKFVFI